MRSEQEMFDLILQTAREDERIRAAVLNGSRANPNAPKDFFQDFDVVYFVTEMAPFIRNLEWIRHFGELMILQIPEEMHDPPPAMDEGYGYLMQFADGNRIDLGIYPLAKIPEKILDSLTVVLLDKDGRIPPLPPADESGYLPKPPTAKQFADCCNEFWWVSAYAAKGLWRGELPYARYVLEVWTREQLTKMLTWTIGVKTGFLVNPGKHGKYFQKYLDPEMWEMLLKTCPDGSYERTWDALFAMGDLFLAGHFGFPYNETEDRNVTAHLRRVRALPRDAREMY